MLHRLNPREGSTVLYDVIYLNRDRGGRATDLTTGSKRYALARAQHLRDRGTPATVYTMYGDRIG
jgi:hypothetical protein